MQSTKQKSYCILCLKRFKKKNKCAIIYLKILKIGAENENRSCGLAKRWQKQPF